LNYIERNKLQTQEFDLKKRGIYGLIDSIKDLEEINKLLKKTLDYEGIKPLTNLDVENLDKFTNQMVELEKSNKYLIKVQSINYKSSIKDNLEEDLKKYNNIPGINMEQLDDYIFLIINYYPLMITIHEQYLPKIYKIYQSIKN